MSNITNDAQGADDKVTVKGYVGVGLAVAMVTGVVLAMTGGAASAAPDMSVVNPVSTAGVTLADTMRAIAFALIPLALGVFVVTRGWKIIKGFF